MKPMILFIYVLNILSLLKVEAESYDNMNGLIYFKSSINNIILLEFPKNVYLSTEKINTKFYVQNEYGHRKRVLIYLKSNKTFKFDYKITVLNFQDYYEDIESGFMFKFYYYENKDIKIEKIYLNTFVPDFTVHFPVFAATIIIITLIFWLKN